MDGIDSKLKAIMKHYVIFAMLCISQIAFAATHNVRDFGAIGDGQTIDTKAFNDAITAASSEGGGTIYIPTGQYLCYSIRLASNITLFLENGATIIAAFPSKSEGYDAAEPNDDNPYQDFGHSHWHNSLLWAENQHDITICGDGLIYGQGLTREESRLQGVGNKAIALRDCYNVTLRDFKMLRCGHFAVLATGVDNLTIDNLKVDTNRDGFDIDCCRNTLITNCIVNSPWDDAIVLKSSYALGKFRDSENITVTNCHVSGFDMGSVMDATFQTDEPQAPDHGHNCGRIKIGTESSGGFRNILISNCSFTHCRGLALETVDGGVMENVVVSNLTMREIVNSPIFLRLGSRQRSPEGTPIGAMRRISISNIVVDSADSEYSCIISGVPNHCIEDVVIENVSINFLGGFSAADSEIVPPENEKTYPEPWMFGRIPAKGFFIRHADGVTIRNLRLDYVTNDERPTFKLIDVNHLKISDVYVDRNEEYVSCE